MLSLLRTRSRLVAGFILLALALAVIPAAASQALAGAPASPAGDQATRHDSTLQQTGAKLQADPQELSFPAAQYLRPDAPVTFQIDDGTSEGSIGFNDGSSEAPSLWLNRFSPIAGSFPITLTQIQIYWPSQGVNDPQFVGQQVKLLVYNDTDGNNDPANATKIAEINATVGLTNAFQTYNVSVVVPGPTGDLYVGFEDFWAETRGTPVLFPAADDQTPPHQGRSWVAANGVGTPPDRNNLGANTTLDTIDNLAPALAGNWLIRTSGTDSRVGPTETFTPTATRTSTPTCSFAGWSGATAMPSNHVRAVGVWYPNGLNRFYVMGGRSSDTAGSDLQNPRYYDPSAGTWTIDNAALLPDNQVNNMVCADLNGPSGHRIYCVGGSAAGGTVASSRVSVYDPVAHTVVTDDVWPALSPLGNTPLPGGFAVVSNRLYILGGFDPLGSMTQQIWEFNPTASAGSRWNLMSATVPDPVAGSNGMGYIPATNIGGTIYAAGGSVWVSPSIVDNNTAFTYVPGAGAVTTITPLPTPGRAETRALNVGGKVWVIGGGRTSPNPSSSVLQYDPANPGAGWTVVNSFQGPRRNFPVDIDPATNRIFLAGGYQPTTPSQDMQIYDLSRPVCTPIPTSPTPTSTATTPPTITPTPICAGSWSLRASYPVSVYDNGVTALNGIIYSFGGVTTQTTALSFKYDPATDVWTSIAPLPATRAKPGVVTDGTNIYIVGGTATNTIWRYDPVSNTYNTTLATSPTSAWAPAVTILNGVIYKIGGCTDGTCAAGTNVVEAYNIAGNSWSSLASLPAPLAWGQAAGIGSFVYYAGGTNVTSGLDSAAAYRYDPVGNAWNDAAVADMPSTRWAAVSTVYNGKWTLIGGVVNGDIDTNALVYDASLNSWSPAIDPMLQPRYRVSGATAGSDIFVPGGDNTGAGNGTTTNQRYRNLCAGSTIHGHLTWQGVAAANRPLVTGTLSICVSGAVQNFPFVTDTSGNFTVTTSIANGTYNWAVKGGRHLSNSSPADGTALTISGGQATQEFGTQKGGNTNPDNIINATDFTNLKNQFGQAGNRSADADYNQVVNASDFTIQKNNFGQSGHTITCP